MRSVLLRFSSSREAAFCTHFSGAAGHACRVGTQELSDVIGSACDERVDELSNPTSSFINTKTKFYCVLVYHIYFNSEKVG